MKIVSDIFTVLGGKQICFHAATEEQTKKFYRDIFSNISYILVDHDLLQVKLHI
jgi:hypothetical protein